MRLNQAALLSGIPHLSTYPALLHGLLQISIYRLRGEHGPITLQSAVKKPPQGLQELANLLRSLTMYKSNPGILIPSEGIFGLLFTLFRWKDRYYLFLSGF